MTAMSAYSIVAEQFRRSYLDQQQCCSCGHDDRLLIKHLNPKRYHNLNIVVSPNIIQFVRIG